MATGTVSINNVSITEGNGGAKVLTFTVTRTGGSGAFSVNYTTAPSVPLSATAGQDYQSASGTLNFTDTDTSQTISVFIIGDTLIEPNETFRVNLSGLPVGPTFGTSSAIGTIINDDPLRTDFNGDGDADIVLQNSTTGQMYIWTMGGTNGNQILSAGPTSSQAENTNWKIATSGDVNGDGNADLVLQNSTTGQVYIYDMGGTGGRQVIGGGSISAQPDSANWKVVTSGDFNRDGNADLVLQNSTSGQVWIYDMGSTQSGQGNQGTQVIGGGAVGASVDSPDWKVKATGDVNGDGISDIVLQNDVIHEVFIWTMPNTNTGTTPTAGTAITGLDPGWQVVGTGAFTHTAGVAPSSSLKADILLQNSDTGEVGIFRAGSNVFQFIGQPDSPNWKVKDTGDYNADGNTDILLQNSSNGEAFLWTANPVTPTQFSGNPVATPDVGWQVVAIA